MSSCVDRRAFDIAVIGGGPAGLSAALWAARYRRRVLLVDGGRPRNAATTATHGYLALDGADPWDLVRRARRDLSGYAEATIRVDTEAVAVEVSSHGFDVDLSDGSLVRASRLILATGVIDLLPAIDRFVDFYGTCAFTCPTCDGYEAQNQRIVVIGDGAEHTSAFAVGMLDWATTVTLVVRPDPAPSAQELEKVRATGIVVVVGTATALAGTPGALEAVHLEDGSIIPCDTLFCPVGHRQHSDLAARLGCQISDEGCVIVDDDGRTSVQNVFAAGDMTPGPHLVQVAAAKGTRAGVAAALSLRGEPGARAEPTPAPDPSHVLAD